MDDRQELNKEILEKLKEYIDKYPNMRVIQLLYAVGIIDGTDKFYEESHITLNKLKE